MSGFPALAPNTMSFDRSVGRTLSGDFNVIIEILAGAERRCNAADKPVF